jgi:3-deoxy-D-manno-octulosonic-acid transferase
LIRRFYTLVLWLALPFASLIVLWRGLSRRNYWRGWRQRFGYGFRSLESCVWIHGVSMGEVQAAATLAPALHAAGHRVLITSTTPTGRDRAERLCGHYAQVRYAPYDFPGVIARVLKSCRPRLLIVLETELWPNWLHFCAASAVPVLIASARLSERSVTRFSHLPGLLTPMALRNLQALAQTDADAQRYLAIGVPATNVTVGGNLKFDYAPPSGLRERGAALRSRFAGSRSAWVAGSTHPGEEQAALNAHEQLLRSGGPALLIVAPRHPQRFDEVEALLRKRAVRYLRRSAAQDPDSSIDVLLLDTMGELADAYAASDLAFVGGSLVPIGGHNLLEPIALGVATLTGPSQFNAPEIARTLSAHAAIALVADEAALTNAVLTLLLQPQQRALMTAAAAKVLQQNRGALELTLRRAEALIRSD